MELEGLLLFSKEPVTGPYPKTNKSIPYHSTLFLYDRF
jgi:hypothetical protein